MKIRKLKLGESNNENFLFFVRGLKIKCINVVSNVCVNLEKKMSLNRKSRRSNLN